MKKKTLFFLFSIFFLTQSRVFAIDPETAAKQATPKEPYYDAITRKFARGFTNIVFSPTEIPQQISWEYHSNNHPDEYLRAVTYGALKGVTRTVSRIVVGAYEVGTFWIPQKPIIEPEFVLKFNDSSLKKPEYQY